MADIVLSSHVFLNAVTGSAGGATVSTPFPCDWHFSGNQGRTFFITQNAADTVTIQATNNFEVTAGTTWYNVTACTGATQTTVERNQPFGCVRVSLTGANGAATVRGVV